MKFIERLKEYFSKKEYYSCEKIDFEIPSYKFKILNTETILDLTKFISNSIKSSSSISDKKHNLKDKEAIECQNLDKLLKYIRDAIEFDFNESSVESKDANWDFEYFANYYFLNDESLCIYNRLFDKENKTGDMIYPMVSIRKYNEKYFFWNHLEGFTASS